MELLPSPSKIVVALYFSQQRGVFYEGRDHLRMQKPREPSFLSVFRSRTIIYFTLVPVFFSSSSQNTMSVTAFWCMMAPIRSVVSGKRQMLRSPPTVPTISSSSTSSKKQMLVRLSVPWFCVRRVCSKVLRLTWSREVRVCWVFQSRTRAQGTGGLPGLFAYLTPNTLDSIREQNYIGVALEQHLLEGEVVPDEEQQSAVVGARCDYLSPVHLSNIQEEQLELQVLGVKIESQFFSVLWLLDEGLAIAQPDFELSGHGAGEQDVVVKVDHACESAGVRVADMDDLLGGDVEESHILEHSLWVGEGVVDVFPTVVIVVVLESRGQLGEIPCEDITESLGLEVEVKEIDEITIPQDEIILASRAEARQFALEGTGNIAHEVEPADRMLVVHYEVVLLLAVLPVLAGLAEVEVSTQTEERIVSALSALVRRVALSFLPPLPPLPALSALSSLWTITTVSAPTMVGIEPPLLSSLLAEIALLLWEVRLGIPSLIASPLSTETTPSSSAGLLSAMLGWVIECAIAALQFSAVDTESAGPIASSLHNQIMLNEIYPRGLQPTTPPAPQNEPLLR